MEVKSIYLDLQKAELKKNWKKSVWKLESEAFKEPLELKIGYDDEDKSYIENIKKEIEKKSESYDRKIDELEERLKVEKEDTKLFENMLTRYENVIWEYEDKLGKKDEEISHLYKVVAYLKTMIEAQSWAILHLWEKVKELEKKATKQPMVYSDTTFISGHERVGLWILEVPSWEYLLIEKYMLLEANEFVENHDGIKFNKITVSDNQYIPMYMLMWWTPLDTPTAKVYRDLVFIPC